MKARAELLAKMVFEDGVRRHPDDPSLRKSYGLLCYHSENYDEVEKNFIKYVKLVGHEDDPEILINLAIINLSKEETKENHMKAFHYLEKAVPLIKSDDGFEAAGLLFFKLRKPEKAAQVLLKAENIEIKVLGILVYIEGGKLKKADELLKDLPVFEPYVLLAKSLLKWKEGKKAEALRLIWKSAIFGLKRIPPWFKGRPLILNSFTIFSIYASRIRRLFFKKPKTTSRNSDIYKL